MLVDVPSMTAYSRDTADDVSRAASTAITAYGADYRSLTEQELHSTGVIK
jgi:hypothetical protein